MQGAPIRTNVGPSGGNVKTPAFLPRLGMGVASQAPMRTPWGLCWSPGAILDSKTTVLVCFRGDLRKTCKQPGDKGEAATFFSRMRVLIIFFPSCSKGRHLNIRSFTTVLFLSHWRVLNSFELFWTAFWAQWPEYTFLIVSCP